ncbi:UNVERIFIED_CONTAM: hypothetical protein RMT77_002216 [Armadillidium vulgare]
MASGLCNLNRIQGICTTVVLNGKRNFRKFNMYEMRGSKHWRAIHGKKLPKELKLVYNRGDRPVGFEDEKGRIKVVPEMIPDIIVPDLENFSLKPYVSYRVPDVTQSEFTPQDLFYAIYSKKIAEDFKKGLLDEDGNPKEPSEEEQLTEEEARLLALKTGSDIFH